MNASPTKRPPLRACQSSTDKRARRVDRQDSLDELERSPKRVERCKSSRPSPFVKMYLRLRSDSANGRSDDEADIYQVPNDTTLLTRLPTIDANSRNSRAFKAHERVTKKFVFDKVFARDAPQARVFEHGAKDRIRDFLSGQSSTIVTYGPVGSGKTYTMFGTPSSPGLVSRSIEHIFSSINCTLTPWYKATADGATVLDEPGRAAEFERKNRALSSKLASEGRAEQARRSLENSRRDAAPASADEERASAEMHCVWLSFAEIYNENVYDLLSPCAAEKRVPLELATDRNGVTYAKGLNTVHVTTALEACRLVATGQANASVARTASNPASSRSHTIFTIGLLKYRTADAPEEVEASTLTFCDLAGPRKSRETRDVDQLRGTRSINNSHLVLVRCMKALKEARSSKPDGARVAGAFRGSKLTRMLQRALSGREPVTFFVNVEPAAKFFSDAQSVLNLCAITKRIVTDVTKTGKGSAFCDRFALSRAGRSREKSESGGVEEEDTFAREIETLRSAGVNDDYDAGELLNLSFSPLRKIGRVDSDAYDALKEESERLRAENNELKGAALHREYEIRRELADRFTEKMASIETAWKERLDEVEREGHDSLTWSIHQIDSFYKERINSIVGGKKSKRTGGGDYTNEERTMCEELEAENAQITSKVVVLREKIKKLEEEKQATSSELSLFKEGLAELKRGLGMCGVDCAECDTDKSVDFVARLSGTIVRKIQELEGTKRKLAETLEKNRDCALQLMGQARYIETLERELDDERKKLAEVQDVLCDASFVSSKVPRLTKSLTMEPVANDLDQEKRKLSEDSVEYNTSCKLSSSTDLFFGDETSNLLSHASVDQRRDKNFEDFRQSTGTQKTSLDASGVNLSASKSGDVSGNDDSGIAGSNNRSQWSTSTSGSIKIIETEERSTQTALDTSESIAGPSREAFDRLKQDYAKLKRQHLGQLCKIEELHGKIGELEATFDGCLKENDALRGELRVTLDAQTRLERELRELRSKDQGREGEVSLLKSEVERILRASSANSETAEDLCGRIAEMRRTITVTRRQLSSSEELRKEFEESAGRQITRVKRQYADVVKNTFLPRFLEAYNRSRQQEIGRLKAQLDEKDWEMMLFKENRDATMEKYESLVRRLQDEIERLKGVPPGRDALCKACAMDSVKREGLAVSESLTRSTRPRQLARDRTNGDEDSVSSSFTYLSLAEPSSVVTTDALSSSMDHYAKSTSGEIARASDAEEDRGVRQRETDAAASVDSCEEQRGKQITGWMKIRRIGARTECSFRSDDRHADFELSEVESEVSSERCPSEGT